MVLGANLDKEKQPVFTRRRFLTAATVTAVVAPVGTAAYLGLKHSEQLIKPKVWLSVLDETSFGVLAVLAKHVLSTNEDIAHELAVGVDKSLKFTPPESQQDIRLVLAVLESSLSGLLLRGQISLFSELTAQGRELAIKRWSESPFGLIRGATNSLRKLCLAVYYSDLSRAKEMGYPGPPIIKQFVGELNPHESISYFSVKAVFEED